MPKNPREMSKAAFSGLDPLSPIGIQYHGQPGSTQDCEEAIERLMHRTGFIKRGLVLTHTTSTGRSHGFILYTDLNDPIAIKSGFSSGYLGTGPRGFSRILGLLVWHDVELEELEISEDVIQRLDLSALTVADFISMEATKPLRPQRYWDYIAETDYPDSNENPWEKRLLDMPLALVDKRLARFARNFWDDPDGYLLKGHRLLETIVARRADLTPEKAAAGPGRVFATAFNGEDPLLTWPDTSPGERAGRANLFVGTVQAYRNVRAHREDATDAEEQLAEFLLLNHLFRLEATAVPGAKKGD